MGEVQLAIDGLPAGVKAHCGRTRRRHGRLHHPSSGSGCSAARRTWRIFGTASVPGLDGKPQTLRIEARPLQEFYNPGGGRNHFPVQMHTVSVGDPLDLLSVKITPAAVSLKPGESKKVEVEVERQPIAKPT